MNSDRVQAGVPSGGQFARQQRAEARVALDAGFEDVRTDQQVWDSHFLAAERDILSINGVSASEWAGVVREAEERSEDVDVRWLCEAQHLCFEADEAAAVGAAHGYSSPFPVHDRAEIDVGQLRAVPESLRPVTVEENRILAASEADFSVVAEAHSHIHVARDTRKMKRAVELAETGIDQTVADSTGSGNDWHRAGLCREAGMSDVEARLWAPCRPNEVAILRKGGWDPEDVKGTSGYTDSVEWASASLTKTDQQNWSGAGYSNVRDVFRMARAGMEPRDTQRWSQSLGYGGFAEPGVDAAASRYHQAGVTVEQIEAGYKAGIRISVYMPSHAIYLRETPPDQMTTGPRQPSS